MYGYEIYHTLLPYVEVLASRHILEISFRVSEVLGANDSGRGNMTLDGAVSWPSINRRLIIGWIYEI